jgi:hypothetical protein
MRVGMVLAASLVVAAEPPEPPASSCAAHCRACRREGDCDVCERGHRLELVADDGGRDGGRARCAPFSAAAPPPPPPASTCELAIEMHETTYWFNFNTTHAPRSVAEEIVRGWLRAAASASAATAAPRTTRRA